MQRHQSFHLGLKMLALWAGLALVSPARAEIDGVDPLFATNEVLAVTMTAPFSRMTNRTERSDDPEEREGTFSWVEDGETRSATVTIRPRGKSRRDPGRCKIPPLRLNFKAKENKGTLLAKQDKLKLVTHCAAYGSHSTAYVEYLWLEYLAYRILNVVTDTSFQVRPLALTYVDGEKGDTDTHPAFLIESKERLAKRLDAKVAKVDTVARSALASPQTPDVSVFQYLLGNTDFSMIRGPEGEGCCHNLVLFELDNGQFLPVPYDFDTTGFVNPPGALPAQGLGVRKVTHRLYRGFCRDEDVMRASIDKFRQAEGQIRALVDDQPDLGKRRRRSAAKFIDDFYKVLNDPGKLQSRVFDKCRGDKI